MIKIEKFDIDSSIPGIYADIVENIAIADTTKVVVGKTVTALLPMPDYMMVPDELGLTPNSVKAVRIEPNHLYILSDPAAFLNTIQGSNFRDGVLTETQINHMAMYKDLIAALKMAIDLNKTFGVIKIVKRDGQSPDPTNKFEVFEAHQYAIERLKTVGAGTLVPFGYSVVDDKFELTAEEAKASITFGVTPTTLAGLDSNVVIDNATLDIEEDFSGTLEIVPQILSSAVTIADLVNGASAKFQSTVDGEVVLSPEVGVVQYVPDYSYNGVPTPALVLAEHTKVTFKNGQLVCFLKAGTLVSTLGVDTVAGNLVKDADGNFVFNFDVTKPVATQKSGTYQGITFKAVATRNAYSNVESIIAPEYDHGIKILQGKASDGSSNFRPALANTSILTFELSTDGKKANALVGGVVVASDLAVKLTGTISTLTKKYTIPVEDGVKAILPIGLQVWDSSRQEIVDDDEIYYNILIDVKNQPSYKINVVPVDVTFAEMYAKAGYELTKELDETRVILSATGVKTNSHIEVPKLVNNLVAQGLKGSLVAQIDPSTEYDLGRYIVIPVGALKSSSGVGGHQAELTFRVATFETIASTDKSTKQLTVLSTDKIKKGDLVELTTTKRTNTIRMANRVVSATTIGAKTIIELEKAVDITVFNNKFAVTLSIINNKDLKGNYVAFQYALISEDIANKTPYRKVIPGTAETIFGTDEIKKLEASGFTVVNGNAQGVAKVVCVPTLASDKSKFTSQVTFGTLCYLLRGGRAIAELFESKSLVGLLEQKDYTDALKELEDKAVNTDKVCKWCSFEPDFTRIAEGILSAKISYEVAVPLGKVVYKTDVVRKTITV